MNKQHTVKRVGCDEVGTGDYLTPIVACAVYIPKSNLAIIKELNIKDSKKLSDYTIKNLAQKLKEYCIYKISYLSQQEYNKLNKKLNANELKMLIHLQNINYMEENLLVDEIVIDQFSTEKTILLYMEKLASNNLYKVKKINSPLTLEIHSEDKYLEVACASILARDFLLEKMKEQEQLWKFNFPLGASANVKVAAQKFLKIYGFNKLDKIAKLHFKTTNELEN
ncbi:ribonuclease HIII [Mesomycoplasma lagogenitalium]|uniref:Ribonuclease n=1 Tax=Mesomycoplasma lagogenitalium TaxID=171286 RepID=A0ABY8LUL5_9BACT|nr:ribonuclease HIII [Mesomycoplasma lagogenitalium]WGI36940.1 ribonuclease HIII [Mesomycoplasma lagogenitalium]